MIIVSWHRIFYLIYYLFKYMTSLHIKIRFKQHRKPIAENNKSEYKYLVYKFIYLLFRFSYSFVYQTFLLYHVDVVVYST